MPELPEIAQKEHHGVAVKLMLGVTMVLIALALGWYGYTWRQARAQAWQEDSREEPYIQLRDLFLEHLRAKRVEQAYALTSARFQRDHSREQLEKWATLVSAMEVKDQIIGESHGQSGPSSGDVGSLGQQRVAFNRQVRYRGGRSVTQTLIIRRDDDSVLMLAPPVLRIDEFRLEEK